MNSFFQLEFPKVDKSSLGTKDLSNGSLKAIKTHPYNLLEFWALVGSQLVSLSKVQSSTVAFLGGLSRDFLTVGVD